ncbi:distal tail protein [Geobacillus phage vB_GthS_PK5.2]|nr:distal tail protein [Geobacillus phage vB_GthS_PK5.2]
MKSRLNFIVKKDGKIYDMHELGIWVSSFHIYSPNLTRNKIVVPGRPGAYLAGTKEEERHVRISLQIETNDLQEFDEMKHRIFELFYSNDEFVIIRDIAPDREIRVLQEGEYDIENLSDSDGEFEVTLTMLDPYLSGPEKEAIFPSDVVSLNYKGTAPGEPVFEMEARQSATFALIQNQDEEYMMIGKPADVSVEVVSPKTQLLYENGETISEWSPATSEMEGGSQGTIGYDGAGITAPSYGTGTGYHGPSVFKEVPPTKDFEIELRGQLYTDHVNQTGRFGFFLFDEQMRQIAFMAAIDNSQYVNRKLAEGRIGPYIGDFKNYIVSSRNYQKEWDNFPAYLRLRRIGDRYEFYVARVLGDGSHMNPLSASWTVFEDQFRGRLRYVGIFIDKYGDTASPHTNRIDYVRVHALTQETSDRTPYIVRQGDIITFNHQTKEIRINGEDRKDLKDFGAKFFKLKKGENRFVVMPSNAFLVKVRYREKFL